MAHEIRKLLLSLAGDPDDVPASEDIARSA
jgi:hypothetical protein